MPWAVSLVNHGVELSVGFGSVLSGVPDISDTLRVAPVAVSATGVAQPEEVGGFDGIAD